MAPSAQTSPPVTREPEGPNLVITDFTIDVQAPRPGEDVEAQLTLNNSGDQESGGPVSVIVRITPAGSSEAIAVVPVAEINGIGPTSSVQLTATLSLPAPGSYALVALVDDDDVVAETNEDDNENVLLVDTLRAPNLAFVDNSFQILPKDDGTGGYYATIRYTNTGTTLLDQTFSVYFFYLRDDGAQGEFGTFEVAQVAVQPGESVLETFEFAVEPGTYLGYALLDHDDALLEMDEGDNEARYDFSVP